MLAFMPVPAKASHAKIGPRLSSLSLQRQVMKASVGPHGEAGLWRCHICRTSVYYTLAPPMLRPSLLARSRLLGHYTNRTNHANCTSHANAPTTPTAPATPTTTPTTPSDVRDHPGRCQRGARVGLVLGPEGLSGTSGRSCALWQGHHGAREGLVLGAEGPLGQQLTFVTNHGEVLAVIEKDLSWDLKGRSCSSGRS